MQQKNRSRKLKVLLGIVFCGQILSSSYSTHKIAAFLEYHKTLGWDFSAIGFPHIYFPFAWLDWYEKCKEINNIAWIFKAYGIEPAYYTFLVSMLIGMLVMMRMNTKAHDEHGTAHWADDNDLYELGHDLDTRTFKDKLDNFLNAFKELWTSEKDLSDSLAVLRQRIFSDSRPTNDNDLFGGKGIFLGVLDDGRYIRDNAKTHVLLLAPTRSGKGVGHIVPTLLTWQGSLVVADPKGENWELTSGYRKRVMKNKVLQFKPMHEDSCKYNPFTEIRITTAKEMGDLQLITKILVDPTGKGFEGGDTHWIESADILLQGVTLHLLYQKRYHNVDQNGNKLQGTIATLSDVLDFLYDGQDGSVNIENKEAVKKEVEPPEPKEEAKITDTGKKYSVKDGNSQIRQSFYGTEDEEYYYSGEDDFAPLEIAEAARGCSFEQAMNVTDKLTQKAKAQEARMAGKGNAYRNAPKPMPKPKMKSEFENELKEGVEGLQKKLQWYLSAAQYLPEENIVTGYKHAPDDDPKLFERLYPDKKSRRGMHPFVRQIFQSMVDKPDKEFGSILSTLDTALAIYRNPILVHNISSNDFVMKDLMDCQTPISLYLVFGSGEIQVIKPLLRVIIEMMWRLNVEELFKHKHRLLMLLDEFPAFGKLEGIEKSMGFTAGYGIKLFIIAQDMNQINALYTSDNYIVSNCQVQIYHGPSDNNSAKYISDKLGTKTIITTSETRNSNILPLPNSYNDNLSGRPLMTPDEVYRLDPNKLIVFCKGCAPILANKIKYYLDPVFAPRAKIVPPGHSDTVMVSDRCWNWEEYKLLDLEDSKQTKRKAEIGRLVSVIAKHRDELQYEIDFDTLMLEEIG